MIYNATLSNQTKIFSSQTQDGIREKGKALIKKTATEKTKQVFCNSSFLYHSLQAVLPKVFTKATSPENVLAMTKALNQNTIDLKQVSVNTQASASASASSTAINVIKLTMGVMVAALYVHQAMAQEEDQYELLSNDNLKPIVIGALIDVAYQLYQNLKSGKDAKTVLNQSLDTFGTYILSSLMFGAIKNNFKNDWNASRVAANALAGGLTAKLGNDSFIKGFKQNLLLSGLTMSNLYMRQEMIEQSKLNPDNIGKASKGFFNDGVAIAGVRQTKNPDYGKHWFSSKYLPCDGPAGGCQGIPNESNGDKASRIGPIFYSPGSLCDALAESFAGPHDWFSNIAGMYDPDTGNAIHRTGMDALIYNVISYALLIPSVPFAVAAFTQNSSITSHVLEMNIR